MISRNYNVITKESERIKYQLDGDNKIQQGFI